MAFAFKNSIQVSAMTAADSSQIKRELISYSKTNNFQMELSHLMHTVQDFLSTT
jgi:hypothetical protein